MVALATLGDPGRALLWVAPVADDSELATEDPLALDYIAQQVGLMLLPALTTRSSRAQAFAMVLYGLALAERAIAKYGEPATDESRRVRVPFKSDARRGQPQLHQCSRFDPGCRRVPQRGRIRGQSACSQLRSAGGLQPVRCGLGNARLIAGEPFGRRTAR